MSITCPKCGTKNDDTALYCNHCGEALKSSINSQDSSIENNDSSDTKQGEKSKTDNNALHVTAQASDDKDRQLASNNDTTPKRQHIKKKPLIALIVLILTIGAIHVCLPKTDHITAVYKGNTEEGTTIDDNSNIIVTAFDTYGRSKEVSGWHVEKPVSLKADDTVSTIISYNGKKTTLNIECSTSKITEITAEYNGDTNAGVTIDKNNNGIIVTAQYEDGTTETVDNWEIEEPAELKPDTESSVIISYKGHTTKLSVKCSDSELTGLTATYDGSTEAGTVIDDECDSLHVTAQYRDGSTGEISGWSLDEPVTLAAGETSTVQINYNSQSTSLNITCTSSISAKKAYDIATSLTREDLSKNSLGNYEYKGFEFTSDDSEWIDNDLNTDHSVERSAFYLKMANVVEFANNTIRTSDVYIKCLLGYIPDDYNEFILASGNARKFIVSSDSFAAFKRTLSFISSATVTGDTNGCTIVINDLTQCAKDLGISDEMLGYIIAAMEDTGATTQFSDDTCTITNSGYPDKGIEAQNLSKEDYLLYEPQNDKYTDLISENGYDTSTWYGYTESVDKSKDSVLVTYRGIKLGDSIDAVKNAYGDLTEYSYSASEDDLDDYLLSSSDPNSVTIGNDIVSSAKYLMEIGEDDDSVFYMRFYFDGEEKLMTIVWWIDTEENVNAALNS